MGNGWYPFCGDARWRMIGLRLGVVLGLYLSLRSGLEPWDQLWFDDDLRSFMIWVLLYPIIIQSFTFILVLAFVTVFWGLVYRRRYPGFNHAVNMTVVPMAVMTAINLIGEIRNPLVLLLPPG